MKERQNESAEFTNDKKEFKKKRDFKSHKSDRKRGKTDKQYFKGNNDPSWYVSSDQMLKDVGNIPFSEMLGNKVCEADSLFTNANGDIYMPGVMAVELYPSLGGGELATDATTVAARAIYTFVRHANSGSANYEAPDLFMMIAARISAEAWLSTCQRAYGSLRAFADRNRYYAETIVTAQGFNYQDLMMNQVDFRAYINQARARLNTIKIPGSIKLLNRWNFLTSNLFVDDQGNKAQTYLTKFNWFYKFDGYGSANGSSLVKQTAPTDATFEDVVNYTEQLLAPLLSEEDIGIMSGDIMKAYKENLSPLYFIAEDYVVPVVYDESMLAQIHNSNSAAFAIGTDGDAIVTQVDGVIQENLRAIPAGVPSKGVIFDLYENMVSPEMAMTASRLISLGRGYDDADNLVLRNSGSEVVHTYRIYTRPNQFGGGSTSISSANVVNVQTSFGPWQAGYVSAMSCFNWHPRIYFTGGSTDAYTVYGILGDLENYTLLSEKVSSNMNKVAMLGLLIPR